MRETFLLPPSTQKLKEFFCESCTLAKSCRLPQTKTAIRRARSPGEVFHSDIGGPLKIPTFSDKRFFVVMVDEYTRYCFTYLMKNKSDLYHIYEQFVADVKERHRARINLLCHSIPDYDDEIARLQTDNAGEYEKLATIILPRYGTKIRFTHAHTPAQNGIAERRMRSLLEKTRALLLDGHLPTQLWGEAVRTASVMMNALPSTILDGDTPYRKWHGYRFDIKRLKIFGCVAYAHIPHTTRRDKLQSRAVKCMFVGYPLDHSGYRLLNIVNRHVVNSKDVVFKVE